MDLPAGEIAEKYELLIKLDEGGMGEIYKVRHRLLDEVRVIKLIRHQKADDPELQQRFLREARTAIRLRHPNIAEIFDFSIDPQGVACIVMEHIDGVDLKHLLAEGTLPIPLVLDIAAQALRALGFLHQRGFVHRDISPDNLMLTSDHDGQPLVKLIDLGIAKSLAGDAKALTATGMFVGKLHYAAPEQFDRDVTDSPRSDLYAFGVLLYELLTGRCPIVGANLTELITAHVLHPPLPFETSDPDGRVPEGLRTIVLQALDKKPEGRFVDAEAFADALTPFRSVDALADVDATLPLPTDDASPIDSKAGGTTDTDEAVETATDARPTTRTLAIGGAVPGSPTPTERHAIEWRAAQERHARAVAQTRAVIEQHLASDALRDARSALDRAVAQLGAGPVWETLDRRLRRAEATARQEQIDAAVGEARALFDAARDDDARRRLDDAFALVGDHDEAASLLGLLKARREEVERRRETERAAARAPGVRELVVEARAHLAERDHDQAADLLRIVLELDPEHREAKRLLGELSSR